jgi:hypothetical protein
MMELIRTTVQHVTSFNEDVRERYEYAFRAQMALCVLLVSAAYLHTVVRRLSPGLKALLSIIPVVLVNIWLPMLFSSKTEIVSRVVSSNSRYQLAVLRHLTCVAELLCLPSHLNVTQNNQDVQGSRCRELSSCTRAVVVAVQVFALASFWLGNFKVWVELSSGCVCIIANKWRMHVLLLLLFGLCFIHSVTAV